MFVGRRDARTDGDRRNSEDEEIAVDLSDLMICEGNKARQCCIDRPRSLTERN